MCQSFIKDNFVGTRLIKKILKINENVGYKNIIESIATIITFNI